MEDEIWKEIFGYPDYQVSNFGRVKSFKYKTPRILKQAAMPRGYLVVDLCKNNQTKIFRVHRLVAMAFIPNPENKPEVNHIDGNTQNNHVENLEWVTGKENMAHAVNIGLQKSGSKVYNASFTDEQVAEILSTYVRGSKEFGSVALAKKFNTSNVQILKVIHGKTYKNVVGNRQKSLPRKPATFLTDEQKVEIRRLHVKGDLQFGAVGLAKMFNVHPDTIRLIVGTKRR